MASRAARFASGTRYTGVHLSFEATTAGAAVVRMDRAGVLRNLHVHSTTAPTVPFNVTVCAGATSPPSCTGTPQCTVAVGTTTCSDTGGSVSVSQGTYVEVRIGGQGGTGGTVGFSVELADAP